MTPEQQRIAIAEVCGWKKELYIDTFEGGSGRVRWKQPDGTWVGHWGDEACVSHLPDYLNDLNAMHEAENAGLKEGWQWVSYREHLSVICGNIPAAIHATAAQRAEAFLRTLDLWKE